MFVLPRSAGTMHERTDDDDDDDGWIQKYDLILRLPISH
jgi:hypothetical protein